jgi:hypothetical protein
VNNARAPPTPQLRRNKLKLCIAFLRILCVRGDVQVGRIFRSKGEGSDQLWRLHLILNCFSVLFLICEKFLGGNSRCLSL